MMKNSLYLALWEFGVNSATCHQLINLIDVFLLSDHLIIAYEGGNTVNLT